MPRILISAAHTLENPGEIYQDLREADLTRTILKKVLPYLDAHKLTYQPVPLDLQLLQRIEWINNTGYTEEQGDVFIEIHINDGGKRGVEGWYKGATGGDNKSQKLSETIVNGICKYTGYQSQGAKSEYDHDLGSLIILNQINPIGTAVECLYIDNAEDIKDLKDDKKLDDLAKAIADSINDYVKDITSKPQPKSDQPVADASQSIAPQPMPALPSSNQNPFAPTNNFGGGLGSGSSFGAFGGGNNKPTFGGGAAGGSKPLVMDREERKEMIKKIYKKILGKEPNQNDLNYYLNTGTNEADLIKKLIEGPDHEKLVKDAVEAKEVKDKFQKLEMEIDQLKATSSDSKSMQESLNRLLEHKNMLIAKLQQELANHNIIPSGQHIDSFKPKAESIHAYQSKQQPPGGIVGFLMKLFGV